MILAMERDQIYPASKSSTGSQGVEGTTGAASWRWSRSQRVWRLQEGAGEGVHELSRAG